MNTKFQKQPLHTNKINDDQMNINHDEINFEIHEKPTIEDSHDITQIDHVNEETYND